MKPRILFYLSAIFLLLCAVSVAETPAVSSGSDKSPTGITGNLASTIYYTAEVDLAASRPVSECTVDLLAGSPGQAVIPGNLTDLDDWIPGLSLSALRSVPAGEHFALMINPTAQEMTEIYPENNLSDFFYEALDRVPRWIRNDLVDNMVQLGDMIGFADLLAELIMNIEDPYVDELAFSLAHISPSLLLGQVSFDLMLENIEDVYAADEHLGYVQINDYGTSADDDYWSTTEYSIRTEEGDTVQVEIDKELYYWFVVHPRISDEIPKYINPATGYSAQPPTGKFWRNYYLNEPDDGFTSLHDMLEDSEIMYGNLYNDNTAENGAIGLITLWIQDVMEFGSEQERPIQPVRIYHLHLGRCGEHQDITAAAARAALIPAVGSSCICIDHVWNEFWSGTEWHVWEPVNSYVNHPLAYEGWGRHLPAVFNWRGDGWIWTVTEKYHTETTTLTVYVLDDDDNPVDGVKVKMYSDYMYGGLQLATCGYTNFDGMVEFCIGGERDIYLNLSCALGNYPANPNSTVMVINNSDTDVEYDWTYNYDTSIPAIEYESAPTPPDPMEHYMVELSLELHDEAVSSQIFNDADFVAVAGDVANLDFFICDEANYQLFLEDQPFEVSSDWTEIDSQINFVFPDDNIWYIVLDNTSSVSNYQRFSLEADLYVDEDYSVDDDQTIVPVSYMLYPNYPNPFNAETRIRFDLAQPGETMLRVFDLNGREIRNLDLGMLEPGCHTTPLNMSGHASGTYFIELQSNSHKTARKIQFLK